jgi:hypothetical protein
MCGYCVPKKVSATMLSMRTITKLVTALLSIFFLAGCASRNPSTVNASSGGILASPLTGKWGGKSDMKDKGLDTFANALAGGPLTGPSSLTLNPDGTGFLKVADLPERPISWKQEGEKVIIEKRSIQQGTSSGGEQGDLGDGPWVATLSPDQKALKIDMGKVTVTLNKEPAR